MVREEGLPRAAVAQDAGEDEDAVRVPREDVLLTLRGTRERAGADEARAEVALGELPDGVHAEGVPRAAAGGGVRAVEEGGEVERDGERHGAGGGDAAPRERERRERQDGAEEDVVREGEPPGVLRDAPEDAADGAVGDGDDRGPRRRGGGFRGGGGGASGVVRRRAGARCGRRRPRGVVADQSAGGGADDAQVQRVEPGRHVREHPGG